MPGSTMKPLAPIRSASRTKVTAVAVVNSDTPTMIGTRPSVTSTAPRRTVRFSSALSELPSPTVPMRTRPWTPSRRSAACTACVARRSSSSEGVNWVVAAGYTPDQLQVRWADIQRIVYDLSARCESDADPLPCGPSGPRYRRSAPFLRQGAGVHRRQKRAGMGGLQPLRTPARLPSEPDARARRTHRFPLQSGGRARCAGPSLWGRARAVRVERARRTPQAPRGRVGGRALYALQGRAGRAVDALHPRPLRQRTRVQVLPRPRAAVCYLAPGCRTAVASSSASQ